MVLKKKLKRDNYTLMLIKLFSLVCYVRPTIEAEAEDF